MHSDAPDTHTAAGHGNAGHGNARTDHTHTRLLAGNTNLRAQDPYSHKPGVRLHYDSDGRAFEHVDKHSDRCDDHSRSRYPDIDRNCQLYERPGTR